MEARAFCPGHVTCFFSVHEHGQDHARGGSRGAGFCIESGVTARVVAAGETRRHGGDSGLPFTLRVVDNGKVVEDPRTTRLALESLMARAPARMQVASHVEIANAYSLPIGAGFGVSGACALAAALAANQALGLGLPRPDCVAAAHTGEVRARSGLGDVVAQATGGLEARIREGAPPNGEVRRIPAAPVEVLLASFGPIHTGQFLGDPERVAAVNARGDASLERLLAAPSLAAAVAIGRKFADDLGLVSAAARGLLEVAAGGTVAMLGDSLVFPEPPVGLARAARAAGAPFVEETRLAPLGARLLGS